jgi:serine---pyruvate transaminase
VLRRPQDVFKVSTLLGSELRSEADGREALPHDPGPDACAARGARGAWEAGHPPSRARLPRDLRALPRSSPRGVPDGARSADVHVFRHRRVLSAGNFGERWAAIAKAFGADLVHVRLEWGETPEPEDLRSALEEAGDVRVVYLTHSETSTGVVCDVQSLAAVAKEVGALVVVDAVSSLGALPLETDAWGIDVVVSGSQKALMTPPGIAFVSVSPAAREAAAQSTAQRFVFDWERTRNAQAKLDAPFTPAVSLVRALDVALGLLLDEGLEGAFDRHARLGRASREGAKAMGLELFSPDEDRSAVVTAIRAPDGVDATDVVSALRDRFGITIANGQGALKGKIFRIGHIGWFDVFDVTTALAAVELALADAGADIERGIAVTRALEAWAEPAAV